MRDSYKVKQLYKMLEHEQSETENIIRLIRTMAKQHKKIISFRNSQQ